MYTLEVYIKSFEGQKEVRANPLEPPLPTGLKKAWDQSKQDLQEI